MTKKRSTQSDSLKGGQVLCVPQDVSIFADKPIKIVHSADFAIREAGTSGGFVSELIRYLFEKNQIGATVSYRFSGTSLFAPELVFSWKDYRQVGSIYHEVHLTKFLKENLHRINTDMAIVCLPCQCNVIRKLFEKTNHRVILISLTCSSQLSKEATYDFLQRHSIDINHVQALQYRGNGWPSGMQVLMDDGKRLFFDNCKSDWIAYFHSTIYTLKRCFQCIDTFGLDADFIVADPWLKRYIESDTTGNSVVIANSKQSKDILKDMVVGKRLVLQETLSRSDFFASQEGTVKKKAVYRTHPTLKWLTKFYRTSLGKCLFFRFPKLHYRIHTKILNHLFKRANMVKKIAIINQPFGNRGDQAAHKAFIELLASKGYQVTVIFLYDENTIRPFHDNVKNAQYLFIPRSRFGGRLGRLLRKKLPAGGTFLSRLIPSIRKTLPALRNSDVVVCAPGGVCMGAYKSWEHVLNMELALQENPNVAIWGRSIGPFYDRTGEERRFTKASLSILDRVGFVSLRDLRSQELAQKLNCSCCQSIDTAFASVPQCDLPPGLDYLSQEDYLVFVPNKLYEWQPYFKAVEPEVMDQFYLQIIQDMMRRDMKVLMLPQLFNLGSLGDIHYFKYLKKRSGNNDKIIVASEEYDSDAQQAIIRQAKALVGARYHSVIFAINNTVPFVCLSYEHKMKDTLRLLSLDEHSLDLYDMIRNRDHNSVSNQLDFLLQNADTIRQQLKKKHQQAKQIVDKAFEQFCEYVDC